MPIPDYIVIEGPIGVGKTSLANRLAETFETDLLLEGADKNPFLQRFYEDPKNGALPTQLFFLFQRAQQMEELNQGDLFSPVRISDFIMEKDHLFAELTLTHDELVLYDKVCENLAINAPKPDLVVYLQAPVDILRDRIALRGLNYEQAMGADYLQSVADAYMQMFYNYTDSPLLIVNARDIDWVHNDDDYNLLVKEISTIRNGRHFFNPGVGGSEYT